jgi:hypothetical protein
MFCCGDDQGNWLCRPALLFVTVNSAGRAGNIKQELRGGHRGCCKIKAAHLKRKQKKTSEMPATVVKREMIKATNGGFKVAVGHGSGHFQADSLPR